MRIGAGHFLQGDCFERMAEIPDGSVDMVLCDLPYGTTQNNWDSVLPLDRLWAEYWRVCKPNAVVVLTAAQPFTTVLGASCLDRLRYSLVWDKKSTTGFQLAKVQPLRRHEDVLVFYAKRGTYNPSMEVRGRVRKKGGSQRDTGNYGELRSTATENNSYYPTSVLEISNADKSGRIHPTQKPVALFEYLIRTYTNPGALVLDNTAGSGTTAVAAENAGRRWLCIERDQDYYAKAVDRIIAHTNWDLA